MATPAQIFGAAKLHSIKEAAAKAAAAFDAPPAGIAPPPKSLDAGVQQGLASPPDDYKWTPEFSKKVWDHWQKSDPDVYGVMLDMATDELLDKGILKKSPDGKLLGPSGAALDMSKDGSVAMIKHWSANHLDPEFFHTELGLPPAEPSPPRSITWQNVAPDATARRPGENIREYVARLRELQQTDPTSRSSVAGAVQALESRLADQVKTGVVGAFLPENAGPSASVRNAATQDYIDYLAAHGVDQRTLDAISSGDLPMDPQSRADRSVAMGLDPKAIWFRYDHPLKREFKGWTGAALSKPEYQRSKKGVKKFVDLSPSKEGLVYASHNPDYAKRGVQVPVGEISLYPLIGPEEGIAGIDRLPPSAYDAFKAKQAEALRKKYPNEPEMQRMYLRESHLSEHLTPVRDLEDWHNWREHGLKKLQEVGPSSDTSRKKYGTIPEFSTAESRKEYLEPLMASGAKGTLVRDETGLATAFTPAGARQLRRADLAPLDTRFKDARNILQSLLVPVAVGVGASAASDPRPQGMLDGLRSR